jgi:hypothetical protein
MRESGVADDLVNPTRLRGGSIPALLEPAGWVAPGSGGPALYLICYHSCTDTQRLKAAMFEDLLAAGVDIRLITIARRDKPGVGFSTPVERTTVAELWLHRDWALARRWDTTPAGDWKAQGIPPADGDPEREAAVEAGRRLTEKLVPLLLAEGLVEDRFRFPTLFWPDAQGWQALVGDTPGAFPAIRAAFGLKLA